MQSKKKNQFTQIFEPRTGCMADESVCVWKTREKKDLINTNLMCSLFICASFHWLCAVKRSALRNPIHCSTYFNRFIRFLDYFQLQSNVWEIKPIEMKWNFINWNTDFVSKVRFVSWECIIFDNKLVNRLTSTLAPVWKRYKNLKRKQWNEHLCREFRNSSTQLGSAVGVTIPKILSFSMATVLCVCIASCFDVAAAAIFVRCEPLSLDLNVNWSLGDS